MKVVSTTLTGNNREAIRAALVSVRNQVDRCIVIDTGITDDTLAVAREAAGNKLVVYDFEWCDDFSAARNFALDAAEAEGADWALTVDADERLLFAEHFHMPDLLAEPALVVFAKDIEQGYTKERLIRLGHGVRWQGYTHECVQTLPYADRALTTNITFSELPKTAAQLRFKHERDLPLLARYSAEHPEEPRWHYFLGAALQTLDRHEEAIASFRRCSELTLWQDEGSMAGYRAAQSYCRLRRYPEAIEWCDVGLAINPETPNLQFFRDVLKSRLRGAA